MVEIREDAATIPRIAIKEVRGIDKMDRALIVQRLQNRKRPLLHAGPMRIVAPDQRNRHQHDDRRRVPFDPAQLSLDQAAGFLHEIGKRRLPRQCREIGSTPDGCNDLPALPAKVFRRIDVRIEPLAGIDRLQAPGAHVAGYVVT